MNKEFITGVGRIALSATTRLKTSEHTYFHAKNTEEIPSETTALIIRSGTLITKEVLERLSNLKVITTCTSGFDHFDFSAIQERNSNSDSKKVICMHTPDANAQSAAELTWALVLACARKLPQVQRQVKDGNWHKDSSIGIELSGKHYGILGLGRIGSRVAKIAQAFGMKVSAFDPYKDEDYFASLNVERIGTEEILKCSDVISFHVPLTSSTRHMMNATGFEFMQRGMILVNTSRGEVISEPDLIHALKKGWLHSVGLDVFEKEPLARTSELVKFPNVVLSSHVGANTHEAFERASLEGVQKTLNFLKDGIAHDTLPPKETWYNTPFFTT